MQKGFTPALVLIIIFLIVTIGTVTLSQLRTTGTALKDAGIYEDYIINWGEDNRLYSINTRTENIVDLSSITESIQNANEITYDGKVTHLCYVKGGAIWCVNSDGSDLKKIVSNPSNKEEGYEVKLLALTDDQKVIFVYAYQLGMGNIEPNPEVKYGTYVFDLKSNQTRFLHEISESFDFEFLDLADNIPIYFNNADGKLFQLDLNKGQFKKLSDLVLPGFPDNYPNIAAINTDKKVIISIFRDTRYSGSAFSKKLKTEDYSQVLIFNYENGEITEVSPPGHSAEYQPLRVSPDFINIVYGHVIYKDNNPFKTDYYVYNTRSQRSEKLDTNIDASSPAIRLNDETLLFGDKGVIYNYYLSTNKLRKIWEP